MLYSRKFHCSENATANLLKYGKEIFDKLKRMLYPMIAITQQTLIFYSLGGE
jgi:hypothetical protein